MGGISGYFEKKKLHTFSTSHSESHPNKLFKLNSQILTQLQKKNLNILYIIFLNTRWKVEDARAVVFTQLEKRGVRLAGRTYMHNHSDTTDYQYPSSKAKQVGTKLTRIEQKIVPTT